MARELYSILQAAAILGVHRNTMAMWIQQGCPVEREADRRAGTPAGLDLAKVLRWREERAAEAAIGGAEDQDFERARARKVSAEAQLAELEVAKATGRLVEIELVAKAVGEQFAAVRARFVSMGTKLAPLIAPDRTNEVKALIDQAVYEALDELAYDRVLTIDGEAEGGDQGSDVGEPSPAPAVEGKRVGGRAQKAKPRKRGRARPMDDKPS